MAMAMIVMTTTTMMIVTMTRTGADDVQLKHVSAGSSGVWGVTTDNYLAVLDTDTHQWDVCHGMDGAKQVDVGDGVVWVVKGDSPDYYYTTQVDRKCNAHFAQGGSFSPYVTISPKGYMWFLAKHSSAIWQCNKCVGGNIDTSWKSEVQTGDYYHHDNIIRKQISAGFCGLWSVDNEGDVFYLNGTYGDHLIDGRYPAVTKVDNIKMKYVSSDIDAVYGLSEDGQSLYKREFITAENPTGRNWAWKTNDLGGAKMIDAYDGTVYYITESDNKMHTIREKWEPVG